MIFYHDFSYTGRGPFYPIKLLKSYINKFFVLLMILMGKKYHLIQTFTQKELQMKRNNIFLAMLLIAAVIILAACGVFGNSQAVPGPTQTITPTSTLSSVEQKQTQISDLQTSIPLKKTEQALDNEIAKLEAGSAPANTATPQATAGQVLTTTPSPTVMVNAVAQVVDLRGDHKVYDCKSDGECLTAVNGWLRGRHAHKVVFFTAGQQFKFLVPGTWSFHFTTDVNQLGPLGIWDIQAFGSIVDFKLGDQIYSTMAASNGAAILWESPQYRMVACQDWNALQLSQHPDWNVQSEYCH